MTSVKTLEVNQKKIEELADIFSNSGVYLFDYRGLSVKEMEDLRNRMRAHEASVKVIRNRLAIKYFEQANQDFGRDVFSGPTAAVFANDNFVEAAKEIVDFEKEIKKIKIKSGFIEQKFMSKEQITSVAKLPGKDQLKAQLAFSIVYPLKKMGMALSAPLSNMLILMKNLKDKKAKEGEE